MTSQITLKMLKNPHSPSNEDFSDAVALAMTISDDRSRSDTIRNMIDDLSTSDKVGTLRTLTAELTDGARDEVMSDSVGVLTSHGLVTEAIKACACIQDAKTKTKALANTAAMWSRDEPEAATKWASGVTDAKLREAALAGILQSVRCRDGKTAAETWIRNLQTDKATIESLRAKLNTL